MIRLDKRTSLLFALSLAAITSWGIEPQVMAQADNGAGDSKAESGDSADSGTPKGLMSLQEMLAISLKRNPDVRAAEANLRVAEAELDRVRLQSVQKLIAFREKWQSQVSAVRVAELEWNEMVRLRELAKSGTIASKAVQRAEIVQENLAAARMKLSEAEAELPFLLGEAPGQAAGPSDSKSHMLLRDGLLPMARELFQLRMRAFQAGEGGLRELPAAHRQVAELEIRLAETKTKQIAAVEAHRKLLDEVRAAAEAAFKQQAISEFDMLAIKVELAKTDLWLLELKGE